MNDSESRRRRGVLAASGASEGTQLQHSFWSSCLVRKHQYGQALAFALLAPSVEWGRNRWADHSVTHPPTRHNH